MNYEKPYQGIRVVDMSHVVAGPYCASLLARLGADVIKIESAEGDLSRRVGKVYEIGNTLLGLLVNLGKRSICLDLKTEAGANVVRKLLENADVFMESFRPGVTERLGFSYEEVKKINPKIIYLSMSGFSQRGPYAERPGTDSIMQAFSGFMNNNKGYDGLPHRANLILMDMGAALYNLQAIQAALWARQGQEVGRYIDNSLLETASALQNANIAIHLTEGDAAPPAAYPLASYQASDGYVMLAVLHEREFKPFMAVLGLAAIAEDPRLQSAASRLENRELIDQPIENAILQLDVETLCEKFREIRMLHERVNDYDDFMTHEQTQESGAFYWHEFASIGKLPIANIAGMQKLEDNPEILHAPELGEHTTMVLHEIGYSADEMASMERSGAINTQLADQA
ncbi:MAG: CoA transferase [Pseudomonadales bacterium]|nr:CoA transferase [Pseudomonadales bacterium]